MSKPYKTKTKKFKYEIMFVVDGDLTPDQARNSIANLLAMFETQENYSEIAKYNDELAYLIRGKKMCHRFIVNFEMEDPKVLVEFNRLALLNKQLLRHLVINETKDRGFRAKNNPKKVRDSEIRQEKKKQYMDKKSSKSGVLNAA